MHNDLFLEIMAHPDLPKYAKNVPDNYQDLSLEERYQVLLALEGDVPPEIFETPITQQTLVLFVPCKPFKNAMESAAVTDISSVIVNP